MFPKQMLQILGIVSLAFIAGCDGGSVGIDRSGSNPTISGPINDFGSVIIDGVHYDTESAEIFISGEPSLEEELRVGDYVTVVLEENYDPDAPSATKVYFQPNAVGPINEIDTDAGQFKVLKQTVVVTNETVFDHEIATRSIFGFSENDEVEASGPIDANGRIVASRIKLREGKQLELSGKIEELDGNSNTFKLNQLIVDYSEAQIDEQLIDGLQIVVKGKYYNNTKLIAERIRVRDEVSYFKRKNTKVQVHGHISDFDGIDSFTVMDLEAQTDQSTVFFEGDQSQLKDDARVRIIGRISYEGILIVSELTFLKSAITTINGEVTQIEIQRSNSRRYRDSADMVVNGIEIKITPHTFLEGKGPSFRYGRIKLDDIKIGDTVEIAGRYKNDKFYAKKLELERDMPQQKRRVSGRIQALDPNNSQFSITGSKITITDRTRIRSNSKIINKTEFFESAEGHRVEVLGTKTGESAYEADVVILRSKPEKSSHNKSGGNR